MVSPEETGANIGDTIATAVIIVISCPSSPCAQELLRGLRAWASM